MFQFFIERRNIALLLGLFLVCFTLMTLSVRFRGQSTLIDRGLLSLSGSAIEMADIPRKWSVEAWQKFLLLKNAQEENIELKQKLQSLNTHHAQIQELKSEIARLEKLLGASRNLAAPVRLARIVAHGKSIYGQSLIVDIGSKDGVRKNMPVMHQRGLVGRISRVGNNVSQVLTLLDSRSAVNVIAQPSRAQGVFSISSTGEGEVRYMPLDMEIKKGDLLISSGLGGIFPKGFPVAHITQVIDAKRLFPKIRAKAIVNFSNLEEVDDPDDEAQGKSLEMIVLFYLILAILAIVFHTSVAEYFSDWVNARPDAILLTTVFLGLHRSRVTGLIGGFSLGIFQDVLSGGLLGFNALLKGLIGYYTGGLRRNMTARIFFFHCAVVFFASVFDILFSALLVQIFLPAQFLTINYWIEGIKTVGLNVALAPFVMSFLAQIEYKVFPSDTGTPYAERS